MTDKQIVRELAKRYMEVATSPRQLAAHRRMQDTNDLKIVRPPVLMDEIPWHQINIDTELTCICQDPRARRAEWLLRANLYRIKYFRCDAILEPYFRVDKSYEETSIGWEVKEDILRTPDGGHIVSHGYQDVLATEEAVESFRMPHFHLRPEKDQENMSYYTDLFGDAMPVKLCGVNYMYFMPWDTIMMLRGMEPVIFDFYDRPEHLHAIMEKLTAFAHAKLDFLEQPDVINCNPYELHCTSGLVSGLADSGPKATWFRGAAQGFSTVSPAMHEEFEIRYIKPIAERFAYTYYGCCEPLDNKLDVIRKISNLRKVGVSPWANVEKMAEQLRGDFVLSRKPNPAHVAHRTDPAEIRQEIEETVKLAIKYGCPMDITLKDISTVSNRPENLMVWTQAVSDVLDQYYGTE